MNTTANNTKAVELTDLQREALTLLAYNKPLSSKITKRTLNSIEKKGWMRDGWITAEGRAAVGIEAEVEKKAKPSKAARCIDCEVLLTSRTRTPGMVKEHQLCSYCDAAAGFENEHNDGQAEKGDHASGCRGCGTYDAATYWDEYSAPKKGKTPKDCKCGCGEQTKGGNYNPGHDARHAGQVARAVLDGDLELEAAIEANFWELPKLEAKVRKSVALGREKEAKAARRAAEKAAAKAN